MTHHIRLYRRAALDLRFAMLARRVRVAWEGWERRFVEWRYWTSTVGKARRTERQAYEIVLGMSDPLCRSVVEAVIERSSVRPAGWLDVPETRRLR